ncbi:MAG: hypothetical protein HC925_02475 [Coleofasciculaceae cyanobacterium SM2_3_26]|nr:hypothetical protein [Coleofasciculaceae cyanobacterium SM2_3_26]
MRGIRTISAVDIAYAERLGFAIKLLAIAEQRQQLHIRVHPTLVPHHHPLANVNEVYNAILVMGDPLGQVMFYGPGAGEGATASAVVSDILNIAAILQVEELEAQQLAPQSTQKIFIPHPLLSCQHQEACDIAPIEEVVTRFYARLLTRDRPGVIGSLGTCFGNCEVSLESIVQIDRRDGLAEIVVVTHEVREGNFRQALADIRNMEALETIPAILRVL